MAEVDEVTEDKCAMEEGTVGPQEEVELKALWNFTESDTNEGGRQLVGLLCSGSDVAVRWERSGIVVGV